MKKKLNKIYILKNFFLLIDYMLDIHVGIETS